MSDNTLTHRTRTGRIPAQPESLALERSEMAYWPALFNVEPAAPDGLTLDAVPFGDGIACRARGLDILAFNRVHGIGLNRSVSDRDITGLIRHYREGGIPRFFVQVAPEADAAGLGERLRAHGFVHHNDWSKHFRPLTDLPVTAVDADIRVIGPAQARVFGEIIVTAFDWPAALAERFAGLVGRPGWRHYLAWQGGRPVAGAALHRFERTAALAIAGTVPEAREKGLQTALIVRRLRDAAAQGCRWMVVETARDLPDKPAPSARNMMRMGFRTAYHRPNYLMTF